VNPPATPFIVDNFVNDGNNWAPVSLGIRVMYNGTADKFGGHIAFFEESSHRNLDVAAYTPNSIANSLNYVRRPLHEGVNDFVWSGPRAPAEVTYAGTFNAANAPKMMMVVITLPTNAAGGAGGYAVDIVANMEIVGDLVSGKIYS